jgi:hypothetical protein
MTIDQRNWAALQHVSCPAANASTSDLHKIRLAQSNHESTRMNTNLGSAQLARLCAFVSRDGCGVLPQRTSSKINIKLVTGRRGPPGRTSQSPLRCLSEDGITRQRDPFATRSDNTASTD